MLKRAFLPLNRNEKRFCFISQYNSQRPKDVQIFVGSIDLTTDGSLYKVEKFYKHPQFNAPMFSHDIGLVRLQKPLKFNENVQPIQYMTDEVEDGADVLLSTFVLLTIPLIDLRIFSICYCSWLGPN